MVKEKVVKYSLVLLDVSSSRVASVYSRFLYLLSLCCYRIFSYIEETLSTLAAQPFCRRSFGIFLEFSCKIFIHAFFLKKALHDHAFSLFFSFFPLVQTLGTTLHSLNQYLACYFVSERYSFSVSMWTHTYDLVFSIASVLKDGRSIQQVIVQYCLLFQEQAHGSMTSTKRKKSPMGEGASGGSGAKLQMCMCLMYKFSKVALDTLGANQDVIYRLQSLFNLL